MSAPTVTAVPNVAAGTVTLTIVSTGAVTRILRSDINGTRPVRLRAGVLPAAGTLTVHDHEPALSGNIQYRVSTAADETSAWIGLGTKLPRFVLPILPSFAAEVENVFDYSAAWQSLATVHDVVGREDPIISQAKMGTRRGSLAIYCPDHAAVMSLISLFKRGQTIMYRQAEHQGMDMYFLPLTAAPAPSSGSWELTVSYIELPYPGGFVMTDPDWTFQTLADTGGTFDQVSTDYADYPALLLNEKSTP